MSDDEEKDTVSDLDLDIELEEIVGVDWSNDVMFFTYEWWDETSQFDEHPSKRWCGGGEYYERKYSARVPIALQGCDKLIDMFVTMMVEHYPQTKGFWV